MKEYTFYWCNGKREVLDGENPDDAFESKYNKRMSVLVSACLEGDVDLLEWKDGEGKRGNWLPKINKM